MGPWKPNHPNGSVQNNQDRKNHVRFGKKWRFCWMFASSAMASCFIYSCHKGIHSISNTILILCADCTKQFVRKTLNCRKTNHGFCTIIKHQLTHRCFCVSFRPKRKPQALTFPFSKTKDTDEKKVFYYDWRDKKIEIRTVGVIKTHISEMFRGLEKSCHKCFKSEKDYFEGDKINK